MKKEKGKLIVALDVDSLGEVRDLLETLDGCVDIFKVGSQLFTSCGPAAVRFIEAQGKRVFLDLKYHDIPNTVGNAVRSAVGLSAALERTLESRDKKKTKLQGLFMYTVHTCGGVDMMKAAVDAGMKAAESIGVGKPLAVGVTVLTSEQKKDNIGPLVLERAELAGKAGLDGVVASCHEARMIRQTFGEDFIIVTPGIRPEGGETHDQERVATPPAAVENGSDYLVVGRPIIQAEDPCRAAKQILEEM